MKKKSIKKVLVANRGEIACRIIAACRALGLKTVAVFSEADASARHIELADEAVPIGPGPASESYLHVEKLLQAARRSGAEALHPGYGFLSEQAHFAEAVRKSGLVWIGPDPEVIELMGHKIAAKKAAEQVGVPTLPWAVVGPVWPNGIKRGGAMPVALPDRNGRGGSWFPEVLRAAARKVGYPLLLKATAGGGGRGMRIVRSTGEIREKAESAAREARGAFGSGEIFLEAYCPTARHIEVQVLGDRHGRVVALGERECSVQRRHQKIIEESPAPRLSESTRRALWAAAVQLARAVGYINAGTCEFIVDEEERFYFLEMNTRLQVEHPVTEVVWGVDIPVLQVRIAMGERLPANLVNGERGPRGHAIEARLYAEDPGNGYMPTPGKLVEFHVPHWPGLRVDTGYGPEDEIPLFYDAMMAKLIAWGMDREQARRALINGLSRTVVKGVAWNGSFLLDILRHERFIRGHLDTRFLEEEFASWRGPSPAVAMEPGPRGSGERGNNGRSLEMPSPWRAFGGRAASFREKSLPSSVQVARGHPEPREPARDGPLVAEHPGKIVKVLVADGETVRQDQVVVVCESMKMEFSYTAPRPARVRQVKITEGQVIPAGALLVEWEEGE